MVDRRSLRWPVAALFFTLGATVGTFAARLPAIKSSLHLSAGTLGLALLGPAVGTVLAMPACGALLATVAPRRLVVAGVLALAGLLQLTTFVSSAPALFGALAGWGAGMGVLDVSMNTEASAVQARLARRVMSSFHATYSIGGLAGAGFGAAAAAAGLSARTSFAASGGVALALGLLAAGHLERRPASPPAHVFDGARAHLEGSGAGSAPAGAGDLARTRSVRVPKWSLRLVALAAMAFACFLCEGAASDWSAVYLRTSLGAAAGVAALAYTAFSLAMTAGRLAGDRLAERLTPVRLVRAAAATAGLGFAAALAVGTTWSGLAGFTVLGAGLSFTVPLVLTAASTLGRPGPNLAFVSGSGYLGMLVGPAVVGGLAAAFGLPAALAAVAVLSVLTALLAGALAPVRVLRP